MNSDHLRGQLQAHHPRRRSAFASGYPGKKGHMAIHQDDSKGVRGCKAVTKDGRPRKIELRALTLTEVVYVTIDHGDGTHETIESGPGGWLVVREHARARIARPLLPFI